MKPLRGIDRQVCVLLLGLVLLGWAAADRAGGGPGEPPLGLGAVRPATPMPAFTLLVVDGEPFDSSTLRGKVVVVRFWATW
jgi:cytochrome oxidase Cu insertion factor (SCO1/SenC/PrrC family)